MYEWVLRALVGLCLAFQWMSYAEAVASPVKRPVYETYMRSAAERLEAEEPDHLRAAQDYEDAYEAMSQGLRVDEMGQFAVAEAVRLYWEVLWPEAHDLEQLRACRALLGRYLEELDGARKERRRTSAPNELEIGLRKTLDEVTEAIEAREAARRAEEHEATRAAAAAALAERGEAASPLPVSAKQTKSDVLGPSLLAVGGVMATGGAALLVDGILFPSMIAAAKAKQRRIDEEQGDIQPGAPDAALYVEHEAKMRRRGTILLVTGAAAFAVGVSSLVWGSVRLARRRGSSSMALRIGPASSPRVVGLEAELRF